MSPVSSGPAIHPITVAGSLPWVGLAIHRHDRVARPDPGERSRSVGDGLDHHDGRAAPCDPQPRTGLTDAALAVLAGIAWRHIAGIRIEMVEQLVEEALYARLAFPARRTGTDVPAAVRARSVAAPAQPLTSPSAGCGNAASSRSRDARRSAPSRSSVVSSGSSAVSPRSPQTVSCETATGSSVRGDMKASAVA